jgi:hypothetical protein
LVVPDGISTSSEEAGTPVGNQFVPVFQSVLVEPVHVFTVWPKARDVIIRITAIKMFFINLIFMLQ